MLQKGDYYIRKSKIKIKWKYKNKKEKNLCYIILLFLCENWAPPQ